MSEPVLKLYEISAEYDRIAEQIIENGGELTPDLEDELSKIEGAFEEKAERVALYVRNLLATKEGYAAEAKRLQDRAGALQSTADSLKAYLKQNMEKLELTKIPGKLATVAIQKNSRASVGCAWNESYMAAEYEDGSRWVRQEIRYRLDKDALLKAHEAGNDLPDGITVERSTHLRIR